MNKNYAERKERKYVPILSCKVDFSYPLSLNSYTNFYGFHFELFTSFYDVRANYSLESALIAKFFSCLLSCAHNKIKVMKRENKMK